MGLASQFDQEIKNIETKFSNGLSNTSTKKFDDLIKIVADISGVKVEKIYITAAASRASNLWNRLAQGKPLNTHYTLGVGIVKDYNAGMAPVKTFIGDGNGRYDAICLATMSSGCWAIEGIIEKKGIGISDTIKKEFPGLKVETVDNEQEDDKVDPYSDSDFLEDVYIDAGKLDELKRILLKKKNLIIQGSPGVGKSYTAKRLAYSIMESKNDEHILNVQFHQSYSYEDFVMGYRPNDTGFNVEPGPFFNFCEHAKDKDEPYFIIIDEINRGNMSRIFGELLMLIENDKRGEELRLLYQKEGESFYVPDNVFIIGMMNTADRSLAVIDYALRRRFSFIDFPPAFDNANFINYQKEFKSAVLDKVIDCIKQLNIAIENDESLGEGFRIGHSYFCNLDTADKNELAVIINYEIIPLLKEYWFDDRKKVDQWSAKLQGALND